MNKLFNVENPFIKNNVPSQILHNYGVLALFIKNDDHWHNFEIEFLIEQTAQTFYRIFMMRMLYDFKIDFSFGYRESNTVKTILI